MFLFFRYVAIKAFIFVIEFIEFKYLLKIIIAIYGSHKKIFSRMMYNELHKQSSKNRQECKNNLY